MRRIGAEEEGLRLTGSGVPLAILTAGGHTGKIAWARGVRDTLTAPTSLWMNT